MVVAIYKAIELMRSVATAELGACISQLRLVAHKAPDYSPIGFVTNYHMFTGEKTCGTKCIILWLYTSCLIGLNPKNL